MLKFELGLVFVVLDGGFEDFHGGGVDGGGGLMEFVVDEEFSFGFVFEFGCAEVGVVGVLVEVLIFELVNLIIAHGGVEIEENMNQLTETFI